MERTGRLWILPLKPDRRRHHTFGSFDKRGFGRGKASDVDGAANHPAFSGVFLRRLHRVRFPALARRSAFKRGRDNRDKGRRLLGSPLTFGDVWLLPIKFPARAH